jgi:hypothetical protein
VAADPATDERYARLVGQVKVLVRTEQRLVRSQRQVESQVRRFRAFNAFALEAPKCRTAEELLACALRLLWPIFSVQAALVVLRGPAPGTPDAILVGREPVLRAVSGNHADAALAETDWPSRAIVLPVGEPPAPARAAAALLDILVPAEPWEQRALRHRSMVLPFAHQGGGALLLCRCAGVSYHEETPVQADEDFLEMVCVHAASAMEIVAFQADLERRVEARTTDLAIANEQLRQSLRSLGDAQARLVESSRLAAAGQLAGAVAHDIANPLAALKANLAWLGRAEAGSAGERAEVLADALSAVGRISESVWRLRRLERADEG